MVVGTITNIYLDVNKFRVWVKFSNGSEEYFMFDDNVSADDIRRLVQERVSYFNSLEQTEKALKNELEGIEVQ